MRDSSIINSTMNVRIYDLGGRVRERERERECVRGRVGLEYHSCKKGVNAVIQICIYISNNLYLPYLTSDLRLASIINQAKKKFLSPF